MPEGQSFAGLGQDVRFDELADRHHQFRNGQFAGGGQIRDREPPTQRGSARGNPLGWSGHSREPPPHVLPDASRKPLIDERRPAGLDHDLALFLEAPDIFDEQERIAVCLSGSPQQRGVRFCFKDVCHDPLDRGVSQRLQVEYLSTGFTQPRQRGQELG
jgi:hypothetical protein